MLRLQQLLPPRHRDAAAADLDGMIGAARAALGDRLLVLGHHFQRPEVLAWSDAVGDAYRLAVIAQQRPEAEYVVVCGARSIAELVDVLTADHQQAVLADLNAGCSLADPVATELLEATWTELGGLTDADGLVPVVPMTSTAETKAFAGRHGGALCTAANATAVVGWALADRRGLGGKGPGDQVLFVPDRHLGRNTALALGYAHQDVVVWDPRHPRGGSSAEELRSATFLLWRAHCSVHQRITAGHVTEARTAHPDVTVIAHPMCRHEVCDLADLVGSTDDIIRAVAAAPAGSTIALATETHLVARLAGAHPDRTIIPVDPVVCPCSTMNRADLPHLAWVLEGLVDDEVPNRISVAPETANWTMLALRRMLDIRAAVATD